jgi:hypothetical protein
MPLTIALAIVGFVGIGVGVYCLSQNLKLAHSPVQGIHSSKSLLILLIIGAILGMSSMPATFFMGYPVKLEEGIGRMVGLPFFVAYFDAHGEDFVGPLTMPGVIGNVIFWFLIPQIILLLVWKKSR